MKKLLSFFLALCLTVCLTACGKNPSKVGSNETSITSSAASLNSSTVSLTENDSSQSVSSGVSSAKTSSVASGGKTSSTVSTAPKKDYSNSTETITIPTQGNAVLYKGKIITSHTILNSDYSIYTNYENSWDSKRNISVYDGKLFYYDDVADKYQTRNAIFTCDENGKNVKEVVKNAIFGIYTIYQGSIYYFCERYYVDYEWQTYLCSSNLDGTDEREEIYLENIGDIYFAVVKDSVLYCWAFEGDNTCILKFDPKTKKLEVAKRYSEPATRHRSALMLEGSDIYYHFGNYLYKVNFSGEDIALPIAPNESDKYLLNKHVAICDQGVMVMRSDHHSAYEPVDFFYFDDLSAKKEAPENLYVKVIRKATGDLFNYFPYKKDDKIILFVTGRAQE